MGGKQMITVPAFQFDEVTHTYMESGVIRPSVTQCLKSEGFINFDGIPAQILERKRLLGTLVHQAAELWDRGEDLQEYNITAEVYDYLQGYVNFLGDSDFEITEIENGCIGDTRGMRYGMKPDRKGIWRGKKHVIELKCGASESPVWGLQLAGYDPEQECERAALQLGPSFKRGYKLFPYKEKSDYHVWEGTLANSIWKINKRIFVAENVPERVAA